MSEVLLLVFLTDSVDSFLELAAWLFKHKFAIILRSVLESVTFIIASLILQSFPRIAVRPILKYIVIPRRMIIDAALISGGEHTLMHALVVICAAR